MCNIALSNTAKSLFKYYIDYFFDIKTKAVEEGNLALKEISKLMINTTTGKRGALSRKAMSQ